MALLLTAETTPVPGLPVDVARSHPYTFGFMLILMIVYGITTVATGTKVTVRFRSFLHPWMLAYVVFLAFLMSVTTSMALVMVYKQSGELRFEFVPPSFGPLIASVFGVLGFEVLFRKFIIGFGETQFDMSKKLQECIDQAVAETLKRELTFTRLD